MADTENNIATEGIPVITLELSVMQTVQAPVDATLSITGQAADAKATGDAIAAVQTALTAAIASLFPIGTIVTTSLTTPPAFYGTWVEVVFPATWGDVEDGMQTYIVGTGTGNTHHWLRTA